MTTQRSSRSSRAIGRFVAIGIVLVAAALLLWRSTRPEPAAVSLVEVDRGRVERTVANTRAGTVTACRRARLAPSSGGQIAALHVQEGDRVETDDILLELWNEDTSAQARAALEQQRSAVLRAEEACLRADVAHRDAARAERLHTEGLLSPEAFDRAATQSRALRAGCAAANVEAQWSTEQLDLARANLDRTILRAPFAGVVATVTGEVGEFTTPSPPGIPTPPVIDLIDDGCLYVSAPIDEIDVAHVRVGQTANITLEALPGVQIPGRVRRIAPYVLDLEKQARTVDIEVEVVDPNDSKSLLVGYSADVEIILEAHDDVVRVQTQALMEGSRVLVFDPGSGRLEERTIEVGISNWSFTEANTGLQPGERVVISVEREGVVAGARAVDESADQR